MVFFFFSSRRRHTRCGRDWSSDVCSSDLRACWSPRASGSRAGSSASRPWTASPSSSPPPPGRSTTCGAAPPTAATPSGCSPGGRSAGPGTATGGDEMRVDCTINGEPRVADDVWEGESLLYVLRERLGLPGSKNACEQGECGSCSVYLDGTLVCACLVAAGVVTVGALGGRAGGPGFGGAGGRGPGDGRGGPGPADGGSALGSGGGG